MIVINRNIYFFLNLSLNMRTSDFPNQIVLTALLATNLPWYESAVTRLGISFTSREICRLRRVFRLLGLLARYLPLQTKLERAQIQYAIMEWLDDGNRLSIHHLKHVVEPVKSWNDFKTGDAGLSLYPGTGDRRWQFKIHGVGGKYFLFQFIYLLEYVNLSITFQHFEFLKIYFFFCVFILLVHVFESKHFNF